MDKQTLKINKINKYLNDIDMGSYEQLKNELIEITNRTNGNKYSLLNILKIKCKDQFLVSVLEKDLEKLT